MLDLQGYNYLITSVVYATRSYKSYKLFGAKHEINCDYIRESIFNRASKQTHFYYMMFKILRKYTKLSFIDCCHVTNYITKDVYKMYKNA